MGHPFPPSSSAALGVSHQGLSVRDGRRSGRSMPVVTILLASTPASPAACSAGVPSSANRYMNAPLRVVTANPAGDGKTLERRLPLLPPQEPRLEGEDC